MSATVRPASLIEQAPSIPLRVFETEFLWAGWVKEEHNSNDNPMDNVGHPMSIIPSSTTSCWRGVLQH